MKKQLFIALCLTVSMPAVLFAPIAALTKNQPQKQPQKQQPGATTVTTAAGLVAAFPNNVEDILAAASAFADSNGGSGGDATSAAGTATTQFLTNGTATIPASSTKSNKLGRLGK